MKKIIIIALAVTGMMFLCGSIYAESNESNCQKVTHTSPSSITNETAPTFTWKEDTAATWYNVWIGNHSGEKIFAQWYDATEICAGGNCSVTPSLELTSGDYEWYIKSWNENSKVWSDGMVFTVQDDETPPSQYSENSKALALQVDISPSTLAPPSKVTHTSPSGIQYTWIGDSASTWYQLWIGYSNGNKVYSNWYNASDICDEEYNCSVTGIDLLDGSYEWYVTSWNDYGNDNSVLSDGASFTISSNFNTYYLDSDGDGYGDSGNSIQSQFQPSGYVTDNTDVNDDDSTIHLGATEIKGVTQTSPSGARQTWVEVEDSAATWYQLWIGYLNGDKIFSEWYYASDICDADGNCSVTTGLEFLDGSYEWYVKSWNIYEEAWSNGASFTISSNFNTYYLDSDGDDYGDPNNSIESASQPSGYVVDNTDCDDTDASIHPGAEEISGDGIDQDCDGSYESDESDLTPEAGNVYWQ